jgi:hypothetical protein
MRHLIILLLLISCNDQQIHPGDPLDALVSCDDATGYYYLTHALLVNGDYDTNCLPYTVGSCGDGITQIQFGEECDDNYISHTSECTNGYGCIDCTYQCSTTWID